MDIKLVEMETGMTQNESVTWAVRSAIEAAVLALIEQGDKRGYWSINRSIVEDISLDANEMVESIDEEIEEFTPVKNNNSILDTLFVPVEVTNE